MNHPATAREALIVEAIGEVAKLIQDVEALAPILNESCRALQQANTSLRDELAGFERRIAAIAENAKTQAVKYIAARADDAAGRSIDRQSRAMADAARVASAQNSARRCSGCRRRCSRCWSGENRSGIDG